MARVVNTTAQPLAVVDATVPLHTAVATALPPYSTIVQANPFFVGVPTGVPHYVRIDTTAHIADVKAISPDIYAHVVSHGPDHLVVCICPSDDWGVASGGPVRITNVGAFPLTVNDDTILTRRGHDMTVESPATGICVAYRDARACFDCLAPQQTEAALAEDGKLLLISRPSTALEYATGVFALAFARVDTSQCPVDILVHYGDGTWCMARGGASAPTVVKANPVSISVAGHSSAGSRYDLPTMGRVNGVLRLPGGGGASVSTPSPGTISVVFDGTVVTNATPVLPLSVRLASRAVATTPGTTVASSQSVYIPVRHVDLAVTGPPAGCIPQLANARLHIPLDDTLPSYATPVSGGGELAATVAPSRDVVVVCYHHGGSGSHEASKSRETRP